ncbi:hypothetical protein DTO013E5_9501 [Penicillium roqueforti]|uniref:Uncharacterized protein n=3 Tax=Penicillium TaxID=5073 RepID=A0A9W4HPC9_PENNA|nr:uncharacterized protein N7516_001596 [Penicillium verrucosum]KAF4768942.1 hypothetical protein HAV15_008840 [Penicillium sp. str. \
MDLSRRILCFILYGGLAVLAEATLPGHSTCIASSSASTPVTAPTSTTPSFPSTPPPIVYQWLYGLVAPDWDGMNCSLPAATDSDMDPLERWEQLKVEDAWNAAVDNWNTKGNDGGTQFSQSLGSFFEYTETLFCENLADNDGCSNLQVKCDEFNHPAGYMIVLSMIWLERQYLGINSAITAGSNAVSEQLSDMLGTFAPLKEEGLSVDNIILDIISLGFSLSMSPMWNKGKSTYTE